MSRAADYINYGAFLLLIGAALSAPLQAPVCGSGERLRQIRFKAPERECTDSNGGRSEFSIALAIARTEKSKTT